MPNFHPLLQRLRALAPNERQKGAIFEKLIARWLTADPLYAAQFERVEMWADFAVRNGLSAHDTGIDLVATRRAELGGGNVAVQCKFYDPATTVSKPDVDSFLATSSGLLAADGRHVTFDGCLWVATTECYGPNARKTLEGHLPQVAVVGPGQMEQSPVDWEALAEGQEAASRLPARPRDYQSEIVAAAERNYSVCDRGTLVMACGTGKTLTALFIAQRLLGDGGTVLFLTPSIALVGQSLRSWTAAAERPLAALCVCSDAHAGTLRFDDSTDTAAESLLDLPIPSVTSAERVAQAMMAARGSGEGLMVVFSTYQSIDVVHRAQQICREADGDALAGVFDLIVCDEAHRTSSAILGQDARKGHAASPFALVHDADYIRGRRRLYMTATPKIFKENEKKNAAEAEDTLFSMDDEQTYGPHFHTLSFGTAVSRGLLTDYKVLVLTVDPAVASAELLGKIREAGGSALDHVTPDMTATLLGTVAALSKRTVDGQDASASPFADDANPAEPLHTAIAFCDRVERTARTKAGTYVAGEVADALETIADEYRADAGRGGEAYAASLATVRAAHVTGAMSTAEREAALAILRSPTPGESHVVCNVGCLAEGVDIPALDAVVFLAPRSSPITLVQSVGRVMRRFEGKAYGYVVVPIVVPMGGADPAAMLAGGDFKPVWDILCALRSHDERLAAELSNHTYRHVRIVRAPLSGEWPGGRGRGGDAPQPVLPLVFSAFADRLYARMVERVGDRLYWPKWSRRVGRVCHNFMARIGELLDAGRYADEMDSFVAQLRDSLGPDVGREQAVEFLAQHLAARPVFDALFPRYAIEANNPVSRAMEAMVDTLSTEAFADDALVLRDFEDDVRQACGSLDTPAKKQEMVRVLYEQFFRGAFPRLAEQLGIVFTPMECVDFIVRSADWLLRRHFGRSLADPGLHALDPFAGTGTFTARALQLLADGLPGAGPDVARRKVLAPELHQNEIVLLSYYVADVNTEAALNALPAAGLGGVYERYNGICLADTFELGERPEGSLPFEGLLGRNGRQAERLLHTPLSVVWGNPPYSVGQRSANDNAQNRSYPALERRIAETYAAGAEAANKKSLYDTYIKAIRWASDRLDAEGGGIVAFISNGAWIDGQSQAGLRQCLLREFDFVYVLNLRGNARTSGEARRREGDNVFDQGSRAPIAIEFFVRLPWSSHEARGGAPAEILYHDIGDYLSRAEKLRRLVEFGSAEGVPWRGIVPNAKGDWINQRDGAFDLLTPLAPERKLDDQARSIFTISSYGLTTNRDTFVYNFSRSVVARTVEAMADFFNAQSDKENPQPDDTKIVWTRGLRKILARGEMLQFSQNSLRTALYRPYCPQVAYFSRDFNEYVYSIPSIFPTPAHRNVVICWSASKSPTALIADIIPDLHLAGDTQCFPLWHYVRRDAASGNLFAASGFVAWERRSAVSPWVVGQIGVVCGEAVTPEEVFLWVYAALHDAAWRARHADDLRKGLPRLALPASADEFRRGVEWGRRLAGLHLFAIDICADAKEKKGASAGDDVNLEGDDARSCLGLAGPAALEAEVAEALREAGVRVETLGVVPAQGDTSPAAYEYWRVEKMRHPAKDRLDTIVVNPRVSVVGIPPVAYQYVVCGKAAVEWVVERIGVSQDKRSGIVNDANEWARQQGRPDWPLWHLLRVIGISLLTISASPIATPSQPDKSDQRQHNY